jgi:hypothetical protein
MKDRKIVLVCRDLSRENIFRKTLHTSRFSLFPNKSRSNLNGILMSLRTRIQKIYKGEVAHGFRRLVARDSGLHGGFVWLLFE